MKIAIITHYYNFNNNYGQRLQNIAFVEYLKNVYHTNDVDTLSYHGINFNKIIDIEKKYLNLKYLTVCNINQFSDYDLYVFGSDQIWNFCESDKKYQDICNGKLFITNGFKHIISYSASTNKNLKDQKKNLIRNFRYISFREKNDSNIYRIGTYNIDPVFLQSREFWESLEKRPDFIKNNEVFDFGYFCGKIESNFIENDGIRQYNLYFNNSYESNRIDYGEFLWLVHRCRYLKTSSFHGFCFGVIFQKQNIIYKSNYRIDNLINILNIKENNGNILNYNEIQKNIEKEQQRSIEYFKKMKFMYCCYSKNQYIHNNSTSGGVCPELAKYVFQNNGIVYGGAYNDNFTKVIVKPVDNIIDYFKYLSKSKYNFSFMPKLKDIKEQLDNGKLIMYIGSPCQILSLKTYLKKDYDNLILVDFRCRGFSRPKKLEDFSNKIRKEYNCDIKNIDFRPNHKVDEIEITLLNDLIIKYNKDVFKDFVFNTPEKCQKCKFDHGHVSYSDITVSDFWLNSKDKWKLGKEFTPENGCNHVRTNTLKGFIFFNKIKSNLCFRQCINDF